MKSESNRVCICKSKFQVIVRVQIKIRMRRCNCNWWNVRQPKKMYFLPGQTFDEERYRQLITDSTSEDRISLAHIKRSARRRISSDEVNSIYQMDESNDINTYSQYPPVDVEPICVDKITINFIVSKLTDANKENTV